jgi:hypothetical protein
MQPETAAAPERQSRDEESTPREEPSSSLHPHSQLQKQPLLQPQPLPEQGRQPSTVGGIQEQPSQLEHRSPPGQQPPQKQQVQSRLQLESRQVHSPLLQCLVLLSLSARKHRNGAGQPRAQSRARSLRRICRI